MTGLDISTIDVGKVTELLSRVPGTDDLAHLTSQLSDVLPDLEFRQVLRRGGWHRLGGIVDSEFRRVAEHIDLWAEREAEGDVVSLLDKYADAGFYATRWQGVTHYLTASTGSAGSDFVQLEVEELQEVLERFLIDPDWMPDDIEDFIDPTGAQHVEPQTIGRPRFVFRRLVRVPNWLAERQASYAADLTLPRLFADWDACSASNHAVFCNHWVLALRESTDATGARRLTGKPVPVVPEQGLPKIPPGLHGAELANALHAFDHAAGYPFAWYFHMLTSTRVPFESAEAVLADIASEFTYLPERDAAVLRAWAADRYAA